MPTPTVSATDVALLGRVMATLRVADLMADAIPALADLQFRVAAAVEREVRLPAADDRLNFEG